MTSVSFSRFLPFAAILAAFLSVATVSAQDAPPALPESHTKDALVQYQKELEKWGADHAKNADEFFEKTGALYYESTKLLLTTELDEKERVDYDGQMAGILGSFALAESLESGALGGERFAELQRRAAESGADYAKDRSDLARARYVGYVGQLFNVRLKYALSQSGETREDALVALVGDAITFALAVPEYGETAYQIVMAIRAEDQELGEEALDALCDAFEESGDPKLVKPIQKTSGLRRYARLEGNELFFEALFPDEKGDYVKKFDPKEHLGKVYLVEVWATWCGPCRKEIPRLKEVYERYHGAGFEIFGYSIDQDLDALKKFVETERLPWPVASQKRSVEAGFKGLYEYYSINGVPEMILVGRDGKVLQVDCRGVKLATALKELFPDVEPLDWDPATDFSARAQEGDAK